MKFYIKMNDKIKLHILVQDIFGLHSISTIIKIILLVYSQIWICQVFASLKRRRKEREDWIKILIIKIIDNNHYFISESDKNSN